jgi:alpha,alpha-trehalase
MRDLRRRDDGCWTARVGEHHLRWAGAGDATVHDDALVLRLDVPAGGEHDLVLELDARPPDGAVRPDRLWRATEAHWRERVPALEHVGVAHRDARHAFAVMSGLTGGSGGMVAAATTSLPERASEGRNYDYRYVWIRDQCYAGQAVAAAGAHPLLDDAVGFVRDRLLDDGPRLAPAYTVAAGPVPEERDLDLPGYPGGTDRIGNWVRSQFQLDAFGEALLLFAAAARHDRLDADGLRAAEVAADAIAARWVEPDAGVWELDPDRWTHSRLVCVAGLRALAALLPGRERSERRRALADAISARAAAEALHPDGRWQRSPGDPRVDAALLLAAVRGAIPATDPRSLATLHAVERELTEDGYCYRYRPDERPLGEAEGAFLLCGFWLALAHAQLGDRVAATRWFERNRAACGTPALFAEEFDVRQRQLRGNLPQAFVHALLLEAAVALDR